MTITVAIQLPRGARPMRPYRAMTPATITAETDHAIDTLTLHVRDAYGAEALIHLPALAWRSLAGALIDYADAHPTTPAHDAATPRTAAQEEN